MPCGKTYERIMSRLRKEYPNYSLKRRKHMAGAILYGRKKHR